MKIQNYIKGNEFIKSILYFFYGIYKKIHLYLETFDKKPNTKNIKFDEIKKNNINKSDLQEKCAVIMHTCDKYDFLWNGFIHFFSKFWDSKLGLNKYLLSEDKKTNYEGWNSLLTGKGEWNIRLYDGLKELKEEYVIYLQEDFWFKSKVDSDKLLKLIKFSIDYELPLLKLHNEKFYILENTDKEINGKILKYVNKNSDYLLSHAISIWKKDFLMECLNTPNIESPWDNEIKGSFRLRKNKELKIYQYNMFSNGKDKDIDSFSSYRGVCSRGEYNPDIKDYIDLLLEENK